MSEPSRDVPPSVPFEASPSTKTSPAASCHTFDAEKADGSIDDDKALARYIVPVLEKGVKTALARPSSRLTRFRIWYNPYRMVSATILILHAPYLMSSLLSSGEHD